LIHLFSAFQWAKIVKFLPDRENEFPMFFFDIFKGHKEEFYILSNLTKALSIHCKSA